MVAVTVSDAVDSVRWPGPIGELYYYRHAQIHSENKVRMIYCCNLQ
jgi:hypothetical protein